MNEKVSCRSNAGVIHRIMNDFSNWCNADHESIDVKECTSILKDFVKSNEHIIQRINKGRLFHNTFKIEY